MPRLFTGFEIPPDVGLALSLKRGGLPGARWIDPENYHITLRFVGDVDGRRADEVAAVLEKLAYSLSFAITLDHLGVFGGDRPRALYAGAVAGEELLQFQAAQERMVQRAGLAPEARRYTPHVTLARLRGTQAEDAARHIEAAGRFVPLTFVPERFVLYSSRDSVGGGPYGIEAVYPLETTGL